MAPFEKRVSELFGLNEDTWMNHANPWSIYTRFLIPPFLALAIFSRVWLGWYALIPVALGILWTFINPHVFNKPASTKHWASKSTFGERIWINRNTVEIPAHHRRVPTLLSALSAGSIPFFAYGLIMLDPWATAAGVIIMAAGKMWFLDRMVWLYEDMKHTSEEYRAWEY